LILLLAGLYPQVEREGALSFNGSRWKTSCASRITGAGAQYYCPRCDGDDFRLYASGMVHCAHCGALMRNLAVSSTKTEEAPPQ